MSVLILKTIAGILVGGSSILIGFYYSNLDTFRIKDLHEWKKALNILKSEIMFASAPLPEAMEQITLRIDHPINLIFKTFSEKLCARTKEGVNSLWSESIDKWKSQSYLIEEDWEWFYAFGNTLGFLDKDMQLNTIEMTIAYIDEKTIALHEHENKNKKMYQSLGFLVGLLIIIICL